MRTPALALCVGLAWTASVGCAPRGTPGVASGTTPTTLTVRPEPARPLLTPGRPALVPVQALGALPPEGVPVVIGGVASVAPVYVVGPEPESGGARPWLASAQQWAARPAPAALETPTVLGVLVRAPRERPQEPPTIAGAPVPFDWIEPTQRPPAAREPAGDAVARALVASLAPALGDPALRWRAESLLDRARLRAPGGPALHPAIAALAEAQAARAHAGLASIASVDRALAARFERALAGLVVFPDAAAPAWPTGALEAEAASILLRAAGEPARAREFADLARAWLASTPRAAAWVHDDAGDPTGVVVGVADLRADAGAAFVSLPALPGESGPAEPSLEVAALRAEQAALVRLPVPAGARQTAVSVRVDEWSALLPAQLAPVPAAPPGVRIGPLLREHTMASWSAGVAAPAEAEWSTSALLQRRPGSSTWELVIECAEPASAELDADTAEDAVRVHLGPTGAPTHVLRVERRGLLVDERAARPTPAEIAVSRSPGRWVAVVPIRVREADGGRLLIAVERMDPRGVRTTWPRPVFPWQASPGRVAVDLRAWQGVETLQSP